MSDETAVDRSHGIRVLWHRTVLLLDRHCHQYVRFCYWSSIVSRSLRSFFYGQRKKLWVWYICLISYLVLVSFASKWFDWFMLFNQLTRYVP